MACQVRDSTAVHRTLHQHVMAGVPLLDSWGYFRAAPVFVAYVRDKVSCGWAAGQPGSGRKQGTPLCLPASAWAVGSCCHSNTGRWLAATAQAVLFQFSLSFHGHAKCSAARKPVSGLTLSKESFISSYCKNLTFLNLDFASPAGWISPMMVIKEIRCISQFVFPNKVKAVFLSSS